MQSAKIFNRMEKFAQPRPFRSSIKLKFRQAFVAISRLVDVPCINVFEIALYITVPKVLRSV